MSWAKRFWGFIMDPVIQRKVHGFLLLFWILMIPPTILLWKSSVEYLVFISVYAVIASHWVGYGEARAEVKQDENSSN